MKKLDEFLSKSNVISGKAFANASRVYKSRKERIAVANAIPTAWNKLIREKDETLVRLIEDTVKIICGYKAEKGIVESFISNHEGGWIINEKYRRESRPVLRSIRLKGKSASKKRHKYRRNGDEAVITIQSTSPMDYNLIPVNKTIRDLFPGYKINFVIETDVGQFVCRVTGARRSVPIGDDKGGAYIQGGLKLWYLRHKEVKVGSSLRVRVIKPNQIYRLDAI